MASMDSKVLLACKYISSLTVIIVTGTVLLHARRKTSNSPNRYHMCSSNCEKEVQLFRYTATITLITYVINHMLGLAGITLRDTDSGGWWYSEDFFVSKSF